MSIVRRQTVFIDSAKRYAGEPGAYDLHVPFGLLTCRPDQHMRVSLVQFQCVNGFFNVNETNNSFELTEFVLPASNSAAYTIGVTLEPGIYRMRDVAAEVTRQASQDPDPTRHVSCTFDQVRNNFLFDGGVRLWTLVFLNKSDELFGFAPTDLHPGDGTVVYAHTLQGTRSVDPQPVRNISLSLDGVSPLGRANISNVTGQLRATTALMNFSVGRHLRPSDTVLYTAPSSDAFAVHIMEKNINILRLRLTDFDGTPILHMPEHTLLLEVQTVDETDGARSVMTEIRDLLARQLEQTRLYAWRHLLGE